MYSVITKSEYLVYSQYNHFRPPILKSKPWHVIVCDEACSVITNDVYNVNININHKYFDFPNGYYSVITCARII